MAYGDADGISAIPRSHRRVSRRSPRSAMRAIADSGDNRFTAGPANLPHRSYWIPKTGCGWKSQVIRARGKAFLTAGAQLVPVAGGSTTE